MDSMDSKHIPVPIAIKFNGKTIQLQPSSMRDLAEVAAYMRDNYMTDAKKQMHGLPLELAKYAWDQAKAYTDKIVPVTEEFNKHYQTAEAVTYMYWISIRKTFPQATLEEVQIAVEGNLAEVSEKMTTLAGYTVPDPLTDAASESAK